MATVRKEMLIDAPADDVWDAVRDFGAVHVRLAPGFVTDAHVDGDTRIVTFVNGAVAREQLVAIDNESRRLVYSVVDSPLGLTHHNASAQVFPAGSGRSRFVWVADLLGNDLADAVDGMMEQGAAAMKKHLDSLPAPS
jgi:uncharacterized protein YndB with AHSA1/START domain